MPLNQDAVAKDGKTGLNPGAHLPSLHSGAFVGAFVGAVGVDGFCAFFGVGDSALLASIIAIIGSSGNGSDSTVGM